MALSHNMGSPRHPAISRHLAVIGRSDIAGPPILAAHSLDRPGEIIRDGRDMCLAKQIHDYCTRLKLNIR